MCCCCLRIRFLFIRVAFAILSYLDLFYNAFSSMASRRLFDQAMEPVRNMRPVSASHMDYGRSRRLKQRVEYSDTSVCMCAHVMYWTCRHVAGKRTDMCCCLRFRFLFIRVAFAILSYLDLFFVEAVG